MSVLYTLKAVVTYDQNMNFKTYVRAEKHVPNRCLEKVPGWSANLALPGLVQSYMWDSGLKGSTRSDYLWEIIRRGRRLFSEGVIGS